MEKNTATSFPESSHARLKISSYKLACSCNGTQGKPTRCGNVISILLKRPSDALTCILASIKLVNDLIDLF